MELRQNVIVRERNPTQGWKNIFGNGGNGMAVGRWDLQRQE